MNYLKNLANMKALHSKLSNYYFFILFRILFKIVLSELLKDETRQCPSKSNVCNFDIP